MKQKSNHSKRKWDDLEGLPIFDPRRMPGEKRQQYSEIFSRKEEEKI
jgi:hypothetical protein